MDQQTFGKAILLLPGEHSASILRALGDGNCHLSSEVARSLDIAITTASKFLQRFSELGLVDRRPHDARTFEYRLRSPHLRFEVDLDDEAGPLREVIDFYVAYFHSLFERIRDVGTPAIEIEMEHRLTTNHQELRKAVFDQMLDGTEAGLDRLRELAPAVPRDILNVCTQALGVNLDSVTNENRLRVVDWYSWSEETVQDIEDRGIVIRSSIDLTNLGVALSRAIAGLTGGGSRRAVIELLSPATSSYEVTQVYAFAQSAKRKFDRHQFTSLVLLEEEMHSGAQLTTLHQPFDGVIEIERTRSGDRIVRKIGVLHLKDTAPDPTFRVLEISEGGMRVVQDTPKPAAPRSSTGGTVLESQDERAQRLRLILQIATERLKLNPGDADALFAMAAAQATLDDAKGGLGTLERPPAPYPAHPGALGL